MISPPSSFQRDLGLPLERGVRLGTNVEILTLILGMIFCLSPKRAIFLVSSRFLLSLLLSRWEGPSWNRAWCSSSLWKRLETLGRGYSHSSSLIDHTSKTFVPAQEHRKSCFYLHVLHFLCEMSMILSILKEGNETALLGFNIGPSDWREEDPMEEVISRLMRVKESSS